MNQDLLHTHLAQKYPALTSIGIDLIISSVFDSYNSNEAFFSWLDGLNKNVKFETEFVDLKDLNNWTFDNLGNIRHESGKFFSIQGIKVKTSFNGVENEWEQPIINQPEVGFLGILCQKRNGILCFLMQGKIEPGNVNKIQISPTLQATKSNFSQVHGGNIPKFLEYFKDDIKGRKIIVDQLQSEQGGRFLRKRNRNMVIIMDEEIKIDNIPENFYWLSLKQLKHFITYPNLINMDTRTVLSCIQIV